MAEEWNVYLCNVNSKLASILIDLGLRADAPIASKPWLLWVWVGFNNPRFDGLHDSKEAPVLYAISDALTSAMKKRRAILSGRISTEGRWELYFYGETREGFEEVVAATLAKSPDYRFDLGVQQDKPWDQYLNVLYPSDENMQRIKTRELLDLLVKRGDILNVPREVQHWMYFPSAKARAEFRNAASSAGFSIVKDLDPNSGGGLPFGVIVSRTQTIEPSLIDQAVIKLFQLSRQYDGEYDGWETPVITQ
jgi:uncharacterized protein (TIGR01619 family)